MSKLLFNYLIHIYTNLCIDVYMEDDIAYIEINRDRFITPDNKIMNFNLELCININSDEIRFKAIYNSPTFTEHWVIYDYNINTDKIKIKNGYKPNNKIIVYISNTLINFINKYKNYIYLLIHFKSLLFSENDVMWD